MIDEEGVPVIDPAGDYSAVSGEARRDPVGTAESPPVSTNHTVPETGAARRSPWSIAIVLFSLLGAGAYFATRQTAPVGENTPGALSGRSEMSTVPDTSDSVPSVGSTPVDKGGTPIAADADAESRRSGPGITSAPVRSANNLGVATASKAGLPIPKGTARGGAIGVASGGKGAKASTKPGELIGLRGALEADGWTVHWLSRQREVRAWKTRDAQKNTGTELRIAPRSRQVTLLEIIGKGDRRTVKSRTITSLTAPRLQQGALRVPSQLVRQAR